tara:strand:+ start:129 stop:281 length:153 start_codon:yes stop_codon:yes gene_type:complete
MTDLNRIKIEVNDSTTSHNGNISVEFESKTLDVKELEALAVETFKKVRRK